MMIIYSVLKQLSESGDFETQQTRCGVFQFIRRQAFVAVEF